MLANGGTMINPAAPPGDMLAAHPDDRRNLAASSSSSSSSAAGEDSANTSQTTTTSAASPQKKSAEGERFPKVGAVDGAADAASTEKSRFAVGSKKQDATTASSSSKAADASGVNNANSSKSPSAAAAPSSSSSSSSASYAGSNEKFAKAPPTPAAADVQIPSKNSSKENKRQQPQSEDKDSAASAVGAAKAKAQREHRERLGSGKVESNGTQEKKVAGEGGKEATAPTTTKPTAAPAAAPAAASTTKAEAESTAGETSNAADGLDVYDRKREAKPTLTRTTPKMTRIDAFREKPQHQLAAAGANVVGAAVAAAAAAAAAVPMAEEPTLPKLVSHEDEEQENVVSPSARRKERDVSVGGGGGAGVVTRMDGMDVDDEESGVAREQARGEADTGPFPSRSSLLEDPPLGEGWDENGNDLSKIANDAVRKMHCEAWIAKLRQEAAAIRAGDHPAVMRRSKLTMNASKRRAEMTERNAKRQREIAATLYQQEVDRIHSACEAAVEQTRDRLLAEANEEIRRSKNLMEGFKEDANRMNTRHTRGNAKGSSLDDPWLSTTSASKVNGNGKRPLCAISLVLDDDLLSEDIDFLRYSDRDGSTGTGYGGGSSRGGGSSVSVGGGGSGGGGNGGSGAGGYTYAESGRARRPPGWRRDE